MNPGPYNEKLRQFAAENLNRLDTRVQEHGRVELTPTMAFVEAMVAVPLDANGEPWCDHSWFRGSVDKELLQKVADMETPPRKRNLRTPRPGEAFFKKKPAKKRRKK